VRIAPVPDLDVRYYRISFKLAGDTGESTIQCRFRKASVYTE